MPKVRLIAGTDDITIASFLCPGCTLYHGLPVTGDDAWGFNNSLDTPTFTPSILATREIPENASPEYVEERGFVRGKNICHSFVTDGKIQFLADCTHIHKNEIMELPEYPASHITL